MPVEAEWSLFAVWPCAYKKNPALIPFEITILYLYRIMRLIPTIVLPAAV